MATRWEKVYIFISSTFNDMHAERDYLAKQVFPELQEWCERRKLRMLDIDLRWGVTEQDATRNSNVVNVCLNRIDECRPFFVRLLGQRYGWVPGQQDISDETFARFPGLKEAVADGRSVTELEVLHALVSPFHSAETIRGRGYHPAESAFFYLREASYLSELPAEPAYLRRIYTDNAEPDPVQKDFLIGKQCGLKEQLISATGRPVRHYQATSSKKARSPELEIPLLCPATLPENVERWRQQ